MLRQIHVRYIIMGHRVQFTISKQTHIGTDLVPREKDVQETDKFRYRTPSGDEIVIHSAAYPECQGYDTLALRGHEDECDWTILQTSHETFFSKYLPAIAAYNQRYSRNTLELEDFAQEVPNTNELTKEVQ